MNEPLLYQYPIYMKKEPSFEVGLIVFTRGIRELVRQDLGFFNEIDECFYRFINRDWGVLSFNSRGRKYGVKKGETIIGGYETSKGKIYITTGCDRRYTVIMLPEEY